jgi:hypothetical protein
MICPDTSAHGFADFSPRALDELAEAGYRAAEAAVPQLRAILARKAARTPSQRRRRNGHAAVASRKSAGYCMSEDGLRAIVARRTPGINAGLIAAFSQN